MPAVTVTGESSIPNIGNRWKRPEEATLHVGDGVWGESSTKIKGRATRGVGRVHMASRA